MEENVLKLHYFYALNYCIGWLSSEVISLYDVLSVIHSGLPVFAVGLKSPLILLLNHVYHYKIYVVCSLMEVIQEINFRNNSKTSFL